MNYPVMGDRVSFLRSHKDEVIKWKTNTYRYDRNERCDWAISNCVIQYCKVYIKITIKNKILPPPERLCFGALFLFSKITQKS